MNHSTYDIEQISVRNSYLIPAYFSSCIKKTQSVDWTVQSVFNFFFVNWVFYGKFLKSFDLCKEFIRFMQRRNVEEMGGNTWVIRMRYMFHLQKLRNQSPMMAYQYISRVLFKKY